jgi:hypothetical protein
MNASLSLFISHTFPHTFTLSHTHTHTLRPGLGLDPLVEAWLLSTQPAFDLLVERLATRHAERVARLQALAAQAGRQVWWPFTQHQSIKAGSVQVSGRDLMSSLLFPMLGVESMLGIPQSRPNICPCPSVLLLCFPLLHPSILSRPRFDSASSRPLSQLCPCYSPQVIDARCGEEWQVYSPSSGGTPAGQAGQPEMGQLTPLYDGCSSWWTQVGD